ncbi:unnamed protein product [Gongylonema pulchrum]|uniref:ANK_REP_REGION domain-containing protein n=1 Tax=Gongylonema pulchrum TaxID=637853 RepID=A0A183DFK3_9BILA|nr:unnamed protein product [Gongylonema pulchrum]
MRALASNEAVEPVLLFLALHNDYNVITELNDMSLRSMATTNFRNVIGYFEKCNMDGCEKQDAVDSHLLHLVLKGLHNENEVC